MRFDQGLYGAGAGLLACCAAAIALADAGQGTCHGTGVGGGPGGGLICSGDCDPPVEICDIEQTTIGSIVWKWCSCTEEYPACCFIIWQKSGDPPVHGFLAGGQCNPPDVSCPAGTCTITSNGGVHTVSCQ